MKKQLLVLAVVLVTAGLTWGDYYNPPDWSENAYFTHQRWEFCTSDSSDVPAESCYINTNGIPLANITGDAIWICDPSAYVPTDRRGMWVVGGFENATSATLELDIPNIEALEEKEVWLQITYFLAGAPGAGYDTDLIATGSDPSYDIVGFNETAYAVPGEDAGWFYYEKMWSIQDQPASETITATINLPPNAVFAMDGAVVDTRCIPEPCSLVLLSLGGLLLRRRKA